MKQVFQSLKNGETEVASVPCPAVNKGQLLVLSSRTLVSAGTERMLVDFGKASLVGKARQQPDKVRMALDKIKTDGLVPTIEAVLNKLDRPLSMGYCNVGVVKEIGQGVSGFAIGDRVASNGKHAEAVAVPTNLCAIVPDEVSDDEAAFTVIGAIGLQGIRLVQPTLGEAVVVTGLGLIGLMTVQLLRAHGCRVLGLDFDLRRLALARQFGAEVLNLSLEPDSISAAQAFSRGRGVDAVIVTAATKSSEPLHQAALMCRKRGRIVLVGAAGLEFSRADFYEKELSFQVSCSYGPGRYDKAYEDQGFDYPIGFVRWTEQRNFEAVLDMMVDGRLDVNPLISHRFPMADARLAYELIGGSEPSLGILLDYPGFEMGRTARTMPLRPRSRAPAGDETSGAVSVSFVGSGNYASAVLIPAFKATSARLATLVSAGGVSSVHAGKKYGFQHAATDADAAIGDACINTVVIATRHDSHAELVCQALRQGKHVFVEKPLTVTREQLDEVVSVYNEASAGEHVPIVMVGFNRRFAPQVVKLKELLASVSEPKSFVMTVNAGEIVADHWVQDPVQGGGRIIGEGCHFVDLLRFLGGSPIRRVHAVMMGNAPALAIRDDKATITLEFEDGSFGTVHYLANGHRSYPKERLEVFCHGAVIELNNFRKMSGYGWPGFRKMNLRRQNKGNKACVAEFVKAIEQGLPSPIPFDEIVEVTRATSDAVDQLHGSV